MQQRENVRLLPGVPIPPSVQLTTEIREATAGADLLVGAIPTVHLRPALERISGALSVACPVLSLAKGLIGPEAAALLGSLFVAELWQAILGRARLPLERRQTVSVYADEFQDYVHLPTDMADALAQARGLGVGLTLAHQHLAQLPSPTYQWVLTGLPGSTLLALGVLREGPTFTALSVFLSRGPRVRIPLPPPASPPHA